MNPVDYENVYWHVDRHLKMLTAFDFNVIYDATKRATVRFNEMSFHIKPWNDREFSCTDSSMYASFLWILSNELKGTVFGNYIYMLNKMLHGVDVPPDVLMPDIFYWPHTNGIVICRKAKLQNYLCMYQGTTIGRVYEKRPIFNGGLIMYPYSSITGACTIGNLTVVSTGDKLYDRDISFGSSYKHLFEFHFNGSFE